MSSPSKHIMNKMINAADAVPNCFSVIFDTLRNLNLNNVINIDNSDNEDDKWSNDEDDDTNNSYNINPSVIREANFKMVKLSNGHLKLDLDYSDLNNSISLSAEISHNEIQHLHVSGIQPTTITDYENEDSWSN